MTGTRGVVLPGDSTVRHVEVDVPEPGHRQVLLEMKASSICGNDIRAIYREHLGTGPEAYQGVIAGHEPCGQVVSVGPGCRRLREGDRVVVYHIAGCGLCAECRRGYLIGCTSPSRAAYGWQRDGGHAEYLLAEENTCLDLPDELSYVDGALVSCGFGTAYEGACSGSACPDGSPPDHRAGSRRAGCGDARSRHRRRTDHRHRCRPTAPADCS